LSYLEWPTEEKLHQLRQDGQVPLSPIASHALILIILMLLAPLLASSFLDQADAYFSAALVDSEQVVPIGHLAYTAITIALSTIALFAFILILATLLQTRFLFSTSRVSFRPARLIGSRPRSLKGGVILRVASSLIALMIFMLVLYLTLPPILRGFYLDSTEVLDYLYQLYRSAMLYVIVFLMLIVVFSSLFCRFLFSWSHRMTREEILAEQRQSN